MKLKVPVNSYYSASIQIEAGANSIYLGLDSPDLKKLTFSGRGKQSPYSDRVQVKEDELKDIIKLAHDKGVEVDYAANIPIIVNEYGDWDYKGKLEEEYRHYIEKGIEAGVDSIIIGDIAGIMMVKEKMRVEIPIVGSTFLVTLNISQLKFLEELGVERVTLPCHVTLSEVKEFARLKHPKIEVFGCFGCSFLDGLCSLIHSAGEEINLGIPCRAKYRVNAPSGTVENLPFLDTGQDCSICKLDELLECGIYSLKIIGRDMNPNFISIITKIYRQSIDAIKKGSTIEEVKKDVISRVPWWHPIFCQAKRCKFINTPITESFIGII